MSVQQVPRTPEMPTPPLQSTSSRSKRLLPADPPVASRAHERAVAFLRVSLLPVIRRLG